LFPVWERSQSENLERRGKTRRSFLFDRSAAYLALDRFTHLPVHSKAIHRSSRSLFDCYPQFLFHRFGPADLGISGRSANGS
jgi:hypothetical protein